MTRGGIGHGAWSLGLGLLVALAPATVHAATPAEADRKQTTEQLLREADKLASARKYEKAKRKCSKLSREHGRSSVEYADCLGVLASVYAQHGQHAQAESTYLRVLALREDQLGDEHPDFAMSLNDLGVLYLQMGQYEQARERLERALAIRQKAVPLQRSDVALTAGNLGAAFWLMGAYKRSEKLYKQALELAQSVPEPEPHRIVEYLNSLAVLYESQGLYSKAEQKHTEALEIRYTELSSERTGLAVSLANLSVVYFRQGKYELALEQQHRALKIMETAPGADPKVATLLNNLALIYDAQGMFEEAESMLERSLAIREETLGPEHPYVASSLHNLADSYRARREYDKAQATLERALEIQRKRLGSEHSEYAISLAALAGLHAERGQLEKAERMYLRSQEIMEQALGSEHPYVGSHLNDLAALYEQMGQLDRAESLYERSLAITEQAQGPDHPHVIASWRNLARLHDTQGQTERALELRMRALDREESNLARTLLLAEEAHRLALVSKFTESLHYALSVHFRAHPEHRAVAEQGLTTLLRRKSILQDLSSQSNVALRRSLPQEDQHLLEELADVDSRISVLSSHRQDSLTPELRDGMLESLRAERRRLWSELVERSAVLEALENPVNVADIQRTLPDGHVLVELAMYIPWHDDDGRRLRAHDAELPARYAAYLISNDEIRWVELGPAAPIDQQIQAFRGAIQTKLPIPTALYDTVMRPIIGQLDDVTTQLIIAPAGALSLVPFGALYDGERYLIQDYALRYVTTGRDLLPSSTSAKVPLEFVTVIANPAGAKLDKADEEADFVRHFFVNTNVLWDTNATKAKVREVEHPLILHVATHGFFGEARNKRDNPMFRSGLELASVDEVEVDREFDDGRLTAYEVSGMDLRGTQLVVLAACDTGMGEVHMSEGVFGLRRAFAIAGAETTVMSLWKISDVTTPAMMEPYYRRLAAHQGRSEAMQQAQLEMLESEQYAHPMYWAAFIVSGDDAPMNFPSGMGPQPGSESGTELDPDPPPVQGCSGRRSPTHGPRVTMMFIGLLGLRRRRRARPPRVQ